MPFPPPKRLNTRTTEFVLEQCQRVANQFYSPRVVVTHRAFGTGSGAIEAIVTTAITPFNANTNTYGEGYVRPQIPTLNANTNSYAAGNDPAYTNSVRCINWYENSNTINTNVHVVCFFRVGVLELLTADC